MFNAVKKAVSSNAPNQDAASSKRESTQQAPSAGVHSDARARLFADSPSANAELTALPSHAGVKAPRRENDSQEKALSAQAGSSSPAIASSSAASGAASTLEEGIPLDVQWGPLDELFDCAERDDLVALNRLIRQDDIDVHPRRPEDTRTPLMVAIRNGHEMAAVSLLSKVTAEQLQYRDANGDSALDMALDAGLTIVSRMVLNQLRSAKYPGGYTPLVATIDAGKQIRIWNLLKIVTNVNEKSEDGTTALAMAIRTEKIDLVSQLLKQGAFIEERDVALDAPLGIAAESGNTDLVALLLERKADVKRAGKEGRTALHKAASAGHQDVVAALLKAKAEVDAVDKHGKTPLQYAAENDHAECSHLLIEHGADVHHADNEGITPLEVIDEQDWVEAEVGDLTPQRAGKGKCCVGCVIL